MMPTPLPRLRACLLPPLTGRGPDRGDRDEAPAVTRGTDPDRVGQLGVIGGEPGARPLARPDRGQLRQRQRLAAVWQRQGRLRRIKTASLPGTARGRLPPGIQRGKLPRRRSRASRPHCHALAGVRNMRTRRRLREVGDTGFDCDLTGVMTPLTAPHVGADLSQDVLDRAPLQAGDLAQMLDLLDQGAGQLLDAAAESVDGTLQESRCSMSVCSKKRWCSVT